MKVKAVLRHLNAVMKAGSKQHISVQRRLHQRHPHSICMHQRQPHSDASIQSNVKASHQKHYRAVPLAIHVFPPWKSSCWNLRGISVSGVDIFSTPCFRNRTQTQEDAKHIKTHISFFFFPARNGEWLWVCTSHPRWQNAIFASSAYFDLVSCHLIYNRSHEKVQRLAVHSKEREVGYNWQAGDPNDTPATGFFYFSDDLGQQQLTQFAALAAGRWVTGAR